MKEPHPFCMPCAPKDAAGTTPAGVSFSAAENVPGSSSIYKGDHDGICNFAAEVLADGPIGY
jgi:hypothetical protein